MVDRHENIDVMFEFLGNVVWFGRKRNDLVCYDVVVWYVEVVRGAYMFMYEENKMCVST